MEELTQMECDRLETQINNIERNFRGNEPFYVMQKINEHPKWNDREKIYAAFYYGTLIKGKIIC